MLIPLLLVITILTTSASAGGQIPPISTIAPTSTPAPATTPDPTPSPTSTAESPVAPTPPDEAAATGATPLQPLLAWTIAPDGSPFVLDATHTLYRLDPHNLAPLARSEPLLPIMGSITPLLSLYDRSKLIADSKLTGLAADQDHLFVGGGLFTQTLVLDRATLIPSLPWKRAACWRWTRAGIFL